MNFENFGILEWLEPEIYHAGPWEYLCEEVGEDGEIYDIVFNDYPSEIRYTII